MFKSEVWSCPGTACNTGGGIGDFCPPPCEPGLECDIQTSQCSPQGCPIIISDRGNTLPLTDPENGVNFDLNSDGFAEPLSWTAEGEDDAFLVMDRNGNGRIDDGTELFGNFTPQPASEVPSGFLALAVFDGVSEGGNEDGWITSEDQVFNLLQLWADINHDGVSESNELTTVTDSSIEGIDLGYYESGRVDRYGNRFRYTSRVLRERTPGSPPVVTFAVDVFFILEP